MFVELLARSSFSFLRGASQPEEMVSRAKELGLSSIAICDRDGLYGSARAFVRAREIEQRVIVGAELSLALPGAPLTRAEQWQPPPAKKKSIQTVDPPVVVLLARDHEGYTNLCRLLTLAHSGLPKGESILELEMLSSHHAGLTAIVPVPRFSDGPDAPPERLFEVSKDLFGRDGAFIGAVRRLDGYDDERMEWVQERSDRYGLDVVASARPLFHERSRKPLADVLTCIRLGTTLDEAGTSLDENAEAVLRSDLEMRRLFRQKEDWVDRSGDVASSLRFSLGDLRYQFPCSLGPGETADSMLCRLTWEGAKGRYPEGIPDNVRALIEKELALIAKLEVAPYFLSTYEVVEMARRRRILCQGRGSAANSAVCYALGITAVDPARSSLLFERFLSAERNEPPDIDIDFEHERREEVIQAIYERHGRERAAMVSEVICYRGKSALREVGKAFGLSLEQVDRLSSTVTFWDSVNDSVRRLGSMGFDIDDERLQKVVMLARMLEGFPRHLSIHVGGFVLSAAPLYEVAPVEPARMEDRTVIPWDKDDLEVLGFFKIDVLGLGMLTAIRKALELIYEDGGLVRKHEGSSGALEREPFDPIDVIARIPAEDRAVYDLASRADTVGVFQIESRAQMAMLPRLRPQRFYDLVIEVAIVRPGPIQGGMVHPYLRRRNGEEPIRSPHPDLWSILERTLGVPLFQEQVMQIAIAGAGYSGGEADQLRRDMAAWKKTGRLMRHRKRLLDGFARKGISREFGEALFEQIKGFGDYGFPESHAASFALLVYTSAWQKAHYPAHFACALLNSQPMGFYSPSTIVRDAQQHGVEVREVDITMSDWDSTLEEPGSAGVHSTKPEARRALRLGFRLIKGLGESAGRSIEAARGTTARNLGSVRSRSGSAATFHMRSGEAGDSCFSAWNGRGAPSTGSDQVSADFEDSSGRSGAFTSLDDLVRRAQLKKNEVEALAEAGALETLVRGRRHALWKARAPRVGGLFSDVDVAEPEVALPALAPTEQLLLDYGRKGLSVDDHPMRHLRKRLSRRRVRPLSALQEAPHQSHIAVAGLVLSRQRPGTASGVVFITLEDETGIGNLVLYSHVFEKFQHIARHATLLLVRGKVERQLTPPRPGEVGRATPVVHLIVRQMERLDIPGRDIESISRDFH